MLLELLRAPGVLDTLAARGYGVALSLPELDDARALAVRLLNERGFKTDGVDGRTGRDTMRAIVAFQKKVGMEPADGYAGLKLLARLRQGS